MRAGSILSVLAACGLACSVAAPEPRIVSVTPNEGPDHREVPIAIATEDLSLQLAIDYRHPERSTVEETILVLLGDVELVGARLTGRDQIEAIVPAGLAPGAYRLTIQAGGRTLALDDAYRARAATCEELANCPPPAKPELEDDVVATDEDAAVEIELLANDRSADGTLEVIALGTPAHGTVEMLAGGRARYLPERDYFGADLFHYTAIAGSGERATAAVSVDVAPVNDPPLAAALSVQALPGDAITIRLPGTDPDGDELSYRVLAGPDLGTLTTSGSTLTAIYQAPDTLAVAHFDYVVNDGAVDSAAAAVTISVGPPWWDRAWTKRRALVVQPMNGNFDDFAVLVKLDALRIDYSSTSSLGNDLRFVADDQLTELPHQIEYWNPPGASYVWVSLSRAETGARFWMYYGNPAAPNGQRPADVWNDDYSGVWHLGYSLINSTRATNIVVDVGTRVVRGPVGGARSFDGDDSIDLAPGIVSTSAGTMMVSIRSPWPLFSYLDHDLAFYGLADDSPLADGIGPEDEIHFGFDPEGTGTPLFFFIEGGSTDVHVFSAESYNDGSWHDVVVTWDLASAYARIFVDGVLSGEEPHIAHDFTTATRTVLGRPMADARTFHGALDELRLLDEPVDADWVAAQHRVMIDELLEYLPDGI